MIFNISDTQFRRIFDDKSLHLPIRWDGIDFFDYLKNLFDNYCTKIQSEGNKYAKIYDDVKTICNSLLMSVKQYLNGFPSYSYRYFACLMCNLKKIPLIVYRKSCSELLEGYRDELDLFRVVKVDENIPYARTRIFHTPYNLRSRVSSSRYSIAGYPSLYLGTSLELCCEEIQYKPHKGDAIASKFKFKRDVENEGIEINVIELALKPQDFIDFIQDRKESYKKRKFDGFNLSNYNLKYAYLLWYPVIAASSFIRSNKKHPFAAEYIVPQLLMQWVRLEVEEKDCERTNKLIGIRYFSCASVRASDKGFNYVFPVSGKKISKELPYCSILRKAFKLTKPHFVKEYSDILSCEDGLKKDMDLDYVDR